MPEPKRCAHCAEMPKTDHTLSQTDPIRYFCDNIFCPVFGLRFTPAHWNKRPLENSLAGALKDARADIWLLLAELPNRPAIGLFDHLDNALYDAGYGEPPYKD